LFKNEQTRWYTITAVVAVATYWYLAKWLPLNLLLALATPDFLGYAL